MKRFVEGADRGQRTLRIIRFARSTSLSTSSIWRSLTSVLSIPRQPDVLHTIHRYFCIYGYLNRVQSSRRLEREAGRNVEVMWLTGRLVTDHKTIADFRKGNGPAIGQVCARFVALAGSSVC
jgi:transposase